MGPWLLRDAMLRTLAASETIGVRALLVHALDEGARAFYARHGFEPSPTDPLHLMILLKDIAAALDAARRLDSRGFACACLTRDEVTGGVKRSCSAPAD